MRSPVALSVGLLVWVSVKGRGRTHSTQRFDLTFDPLEFDLQFSVAMVAAVLASYHAFPYDLSLLVDSSRAFSVVNLRDRNYVASPL